MTLPRRLATCAVPLVLVLTAACGGGGGDAAPAPAPSSTDPPGPTTTTLAPTAPLTGRPVTDPAVLRRAALAVKIDHAAAARPQSGIDKADVIYEEITEGITRFIVVFHSQTADTIGPVRSVRPADPDIVAPLDGLVAFSGGSAPIEALVRSAGLATVDEDDTDTLRRRPDRRAPFNLYTSSDALYRKVPAGATVPPPAFAQFLKPGEAFSAPGAEPTTQLTVALTSDVSASYAWDAASSTWKRSTNGRPDMLEGGAQIAPTNIIIQFTPYLVFPQDREVTYPDVVGDGDAWIFANGSMVRARFSKPSPGAVTAFTDPSGAPVVLPPGQTFVELVRPGSRITTG